jgi:pSer/pThr/pTyr-binding forkhead associated (FHA) protein
MRALVGLDCHYRGHRLRRHQVHGIGGVLGERDLDSSNGTLVNGHYITEAHLMPGDRLTVGLTRFEVRYEGKWSTNFFRPSLQTPA